MVVSRQTGLSRALLVLVSVGVVALLAAVIHAPRAEAAPLTVTSNADSGPGTLRAAVDTANSNGEADTITFDLPPGERTITLASGQISFTESAFETEVDGGGVVTVSGSDASRVFDVAEGVALEVRGLTVRDGFVPRGDGSAADQSGGGIRNGGALTVSDSTVSDNFADQQGGGIYNGEDDTLAVTGSTFSGNDANSGAGIFNEGGSTVEDGTATIANSVISGNAAVFNGGAIYNSGVLEVAGTAMIGNTANGNAGGGVAQFRLGTMTIDRSTVSGNTSEDGGGVYIDSGDATIERSTVSGNTGTEEGGGIHSNTTLDGETATVRNSTISGNSSETSGGGIYVFNGLISIENTTITGNTAPEGQGSGVASSGRNDTTRTEVSSSIIAANEGPDPSAGTDVDYVGFTTNTFSSEGYNVIGDGNATGAFNQTGDQTDVSDPRLGPLADNGGPTRTHALLSGSPAVDAGQTNLATDQRGRPRPQDGDADGMAQDDAGSFECAPGSVRFARDAYAVDENAGTVTVTVLREDGADGEVSVGYATSDGTAEAGSDYAARSGTLTFADGQKSLTFTVPIEDDALDEANETVRLALSDPQDGATLGVPRSAVLTIKDDDAAPSLSIDDVSVTEGDSGTREATFSVALDRESSRSVTVDFATAEDAAEAPGDYGATSGTLTFAPGETQETVTVSVNGDALDEPDETFEVNLSNPSNATISDGQGVGTITDDDAAPSLTISDRSVTEGDTGTKQAAFVVGLSSASARTVTVGYATSDGTAASPSDYVAEGGTLTFTPGQTQKSVAVGVRGDATFEPDETFFVRLSNPTNATVSDASGRGTILDDDANKCTVEGTGGDEKLRGTSGRDVICALGGDDTVLAFGGDDIVRGGPGDDTVDAAEGSDRVDGGGGNDTLAGGDGTDTIVGGVGRDLITGQGGDDTLDGRDGSGTDTMSGGPGTDVCRRDPGDTVAGCP